MFTKKFCFSTVFHLSLLLFFHNSYGQQLFKSISQKKNTSVSITSPHSLNLPKATSVPTITSINPGKAEAGETITIAGTNFDGSSAISIGGTPVASFNINSTTSITAIVGNGPSGDVVVTNSVGTSNSFSGFTIITKENGESTPAASTDFTIPDVGQSNLNIIVTPSFLLNKIYYKSRLAFSGTFWGNSFGIDSSKQRVGAKILNTQTSMIGLKLEGVWSFSNSDAVNQIGLSGELNLLYKKISFFDTSSNSSTNITPFVIHPKIGLISSFFNANLFLSAYYNILTVQTENAKFTDFFISNKKTVFVYPEFNVSGIFDVSANSNQSIKVSFDLIVNNKAAKYISNSSDHLIPYLKIGFFSKLK